MIDFTPIIEAIIALLAAFITMKVIPWIKAKTTNEQQARIESAVRIAVFAAEQLYGAGHGKEKMEYAANYLRGNGFDVDVAQIEAAVSMHINSLKLLGYNEPVAETESPSEE